MTGTRRVLSLCFRGGREAVEFPLNATVTRKRTLGCPAPFLLPRLEPCFTSQNLKCLCAIKPYCQGCARCSRDPCGVGSEPGGSTELQMNPVILLEPGTRRNPGPAQRAAAPRSVLWSRERNCWMGWNQEIVTSWNSTYDLVWYLYELNGIWPFYYLLLGSVFPLLGFCPWVSV